MSITASKLYNWVACPHRVTLDEYGDAAARDPVNAFVELLWERGIKYEQEVMAGVGQPFLDLSGYSAEKQQRLTMQAMKAGEPLIYSGRISADDLLGVPDLLRREDGGYLPGDIKSGRAEEGEGDAARPKRHYAIQLALYVDVLERLGYAAGRRGFIWDVHGEEVIYDLTVPVSAHSACRWWDDYEGCLAEARAALARDVQTLPAYTSECKLCHWYSHCSYDLRARDDLTLIPELGRARRDALAVELRTIGDLAVAEPQDYIEDVRTRFSGIGPDRLRKFHERARLLADPNARPYITTALALPAAERELFFDVEVDPLRDICYLHGFLERVNGDTASERYVPFFAEAPEAEAEREAFAAAFAYWRTAQPCATYFYSKYERTIWRKLQQKYPDVCTSADIDEMFEASRAIDLYNDVVRCCTEWPTHDYSIKTLATYLGFRWRDSHPSGAASIEWYDRWVHEGSRSIKERILKYNEDDCRATRVLLDGIRDMQRQ
jgi:predicted RecB family nuclease